MIGLPEGLQIALTRRPIRRHARSEHRRAVKQRLWPESGSGGGIERPVVRRPVEIDNETGIASGQHAGANILRKIVQLRQMPVGIRQRACRVAQPRLNLRRKLRTGMRY